MSNRFPRLSQGRALVLLLLVGVLGCHAKPLSPLDRERWARAWIEAVNSHQWAQLAPLIAGGTYADPYTPSPLAGQSLAFHVNGLWKLFPRLHLQVRHVSGDDRTIVVEWEFRGAVKDSRPVLGVFILEIGEKTILGVRGYFDPWSLAAAHNAAGGG